MAAVRPDPGKDLIGYLNWLGDRVEALEAERAERRVSASAAARALGYSEDFLHGKPWRVPGFGVEGTLHTLSAWRRWLSERTDAERRAAWDALPASERARLRGAA